MIEWQYKMDSGEYIDCNVYFNSMMKRQIGENCPEDSQFQFIHYVK